jgi:hypothetical protein
MGWGETAAKSHARRLVGEGYVARHAMTRGLGSLLVASRRGAGAIGLSGLGAPAAPAPTWWAHDCACAWTAAWLSRWGREWRGPRELLADSHLAGELEWRTRSRSRRAGHRPDLALEISSGPVAIEVELERKSSARLDAILSLYVRWASQKRIGGVLYVCGDESLADRVGEHGEKAGLSDGALRTELLETVTAEAIEGRQ